MQSIANTQGSIVKLVAGGEQGLAHLSDAELHASTRGLVSASNTTFAALLLHLAEVEARGIHRQLACASLYTYCIYELRMSEDAAARRSSAARLVKAFPALLPAIAGGELHLTGMLMLGPHLTLDNHVEVLARAKFRTKKELAKLVRELHPLPDVPDRVEALGPDAPRFPGEPTWQEWIASLCPPVRELPKPSQSEQAELNLVAPVDDDRSEPPNLSASESVHRGSAALVGTAAAKHAGGHRASGAVQNEASAPVHDGSDALARRDLHDGSDALARRDLHDASDALARRDLHDASDALARRDLQAITAPQRYRVQFTASEEHVRLVERAKALLARSAPGSSLGELHQRAMELLVERLEKAKFALPNRPQRKMVPRSASLAESGDGDRIRPGAVGIDAGMNADEQGSPRQSLQSHTPPAVEQRDLESSPGTPNFRSCPEPERQNSAPCKQRQRGRHVPAAVRREVFVRDAARCTYVDERGERCRETRYLELHHVESFARGGEHVANNLALRCAAHNALAAEQDFGRAFIERQRHSARHDSLAAQTRALHSSG